MIEEPNSQPSQNDLKMQFSSKGRANSGSGVIRPQFLEKVFNIAFIVLSCLWVLLFLSIFFPIFDITQGLGYIIELLFLLQLIYLVAGIVFAIRYKNWKMFLKPLAQIIVLFVLYIAGVILAAGVFT